MMISSFAPGSRFRLIAFTLLTATTVFFASVSPASAAKLQAQEPTNGTASLTGGGPALQQLRYDLTLYSFDGTPLAVTLFQPALAKGQPAPLVLYSHGWGGSRSKALEETDFLTETARRLWESGHYVVTFDQRGFGESGGQANVQNPDIEGRDVQAVLDWAEGALTPHLAYMKGSPRVGAIGLSYGGGFQLIGAGMDPRFDALVPVITWNYLPYSLAPNRVPKTLWLSFLMGAGSATGKPATWLYESYVETLLGDVSDKTMNQLSENGLSTFCDGSRADGRSVPQVDAFFIQGVNDTLFNTNEAVRNHDCLRQAGNDSYLFVTSGGHTLPGLQAGTVGSVERSMRCGATSYDLGDLTYRFLNEKLRNLKSSVALPRVCIAQGTRQGFVAESFPIGGRSFSVARNSLLVGPPSVDLVLNLLAKLDADTLARVLSQLSADTMDLMLGALLGFGDPAVISESIADVLAVLPPQLLSEMATAPRFVPVHMALGQETLAGIPTLDLHVEGQPLLDPRLFVGIGVKRFGRLSPELLNDQVLPLRQLGAVQSELIGVSSQLQFGDQVGLILYGFHPQFAASFSKLPSTVKLSGKVDLPLHR